MTLTNNTGSGLYVQGSFNLIAGNTLHVSLIGSSNAVFENAGGGFFLVGSNNTVVGNNFNDFFMQNANSNIIIDNTVSGANEGLTVGFYGEECSYNLFAGNTVENSGLWGLSMRAGSYNVFYGNLVTGTGKLGHDGYGLTLGGHSFVVDKNLFTHNIFANNAHNFGTNWPVNGANSFDDGDGGNYWDDYLIKYPNSTEMDQSGTGSTPYVLTDNNIDNHPLLSRPNVSDKLPALPEPWASLLPTLSPLPTLPSSPSTTFSPTSSPKTTQNPTVSPPPSSSATPSPSPNLSSTISPTPSSSDQQSASSPEPQQSTFPTELIYLAAGAIAFAVIATAVFVLRRKT
jgi:parallel beta-helix repeat protein